MGIRRCPYRSELAVGLWYEAERLRRYARAGGDPADRSVPVLMELAEGCIRQARIEDERGAALRFRRRLDARRRVTTVVTKG